MIPIKKLTDTLFMSRCQFYNTIKPNQNLKSYRAILKLNPRLFIKILQYSHESTSVGKKQAPEVSYQKVVLKNYAKFTVEDLRNSCFPANFAEFLRTPFLQNISGGCFWLEYLSDKVACVQDTY